MLRSFCSKLSPKCAAEYHYGWLPCCLIISKLIFFVVVVHCCSSFMLVLHLEKVVGLNLQGSCGVISASMVKIWTEQCLSFHAGLYEGNPSWPFGLPNGLVHGWVWEAPGPLDADNFSLRKLRAWVGMEPWVEETKTGWWWGRGNSGLHRYVWGSVE